MFGFIKRLFGLEKNIANAVTEALKEDAAREALQEVYEADKPKKATKSKKTKKGTGTCDLSKLTKAQLLAEAKHRGVKANASLKKEEILKRLS